jgi:hypothetical protein
MGYELLGSKIAANPDSQLAESVAKGFPQ